KGCARNGASCRCRTWQGNNHCLRPTPNLAPFLAATRLATKRQQTLGGVVPGFAGSGLFCMMAGRARPAPIEVEHAGRISSEFPVREVCGIPDVSLRCQMTLPMEY